MRARHLHRGLTLLELAMALAVLVILAALALPRGQAQQGTAYAAQGVTHQPPLGPPVAPGAPAGRAAAYQL
jgi:prepilin-type N-terminal cleavage/methylation domain-containing protein